MSISNIIDPATKKIFPSLINGQGGAVDSVNVKEGLQNLGTTIDVVLGLDTDNLGDMLIGNGNQGEADILQIGALNQVLRVVNQPAGLVPAWSNESTASVFTSQGELLYGGVGPAFTPQDLPIGTAGQVLKVNGGATAPEWANETVELPFTVEGQMVYAGAGPAFNPQALNIGTAGQFLSVNAGIPAWVNGSSGGLQDGFGLYLSTMVSMNNQNDNAPDNGPFIPFTNAPAPLTSGICNNLQIYNGGVGFPVGLRWVGANPVAVFFQADLLCQAKVVATNNPFDTLGPPNENYGYASAGVQCAIKDSTGGYITPICRYLIGGHQSSGIGTYESTFTYQGIMKTNDVAEFNAITNWVFNQDPATSPFTPAGQTAGDIKFDILLGPVNVYVCECAIPS